MAFSFHISSLVNARRTQMCFIAINSLCKSGFIQSLQVSLSSGFSYLQKSRSFVSSTKILLGTKRIKYIQTEDGPIPVPRRAGTGYSLFLIARSKILKTEPLRQSSYNANDDSIFGETQNNTNNINNDNSHLNDTDKFNCEEFGGKAVNIASNNEKVHVPLALSNLVKEWKKLTDAERKEWQDVAQIEWLKYCAEIDALKAKYPEQMKAFKWKTKIASSTDKSSVFRRQTPITAYQLFIRDYFMKLKESGGSGKSITATPVSTFTEAVGVWRNLSEKEKFFWKKECSNAENNLNYKFNEEEEISKAEKRRKIEQKKKIQQEIEEAKNLPRFMRKTNNDNDIFD